MIIRGRINGVRMNAMAIVLPRKLVRARKKAAGAPKHMASAAVRKPTLSDGVLAVIQVGCSRMVTYPLSEPHLGGQSMKPSVVKETGTMKKLGAARNTNNKATPSRSTTRPDTRGGRSILRAASTSHNIAIQS